MDQVKGFKVKGCKLPEFATEIWHGFLYVNLDGKAKPLAPRLKGLEPYVRNYHAEQMINQFVYEDVWNTNWKCLNENFMEGYHLSVTHMNSLHKITPTRLCEKFPGGEGYTGYKSHYDPNFPQRTPYHKDVTNVEKRMSMMYCVYPSHVVGLNPSGVIYMCLSPRSAEHVATRWGWASFDPKPSRKAIKVALDLYKCINREDREKLEALQRGLMSRLSTSTLLGPPDLEGPVWDMYQYLAGKLTSETKQKTRLRRAS
jgi:phenylpropionate dioxygenase-like ring-hydroxylating dioxygenase large terminal subunit